jgi:hypothetical protein
VAKTIAVTLGIALALSIVAGCGDNETTPASGDAGRGGTSAAGSGAAGSGGAAGAPADASADLYGSFNVSFVPADPGTMSDARTSIIGKFSDGPTPNPEVWKVEREVDNCQLYVPDPVLCQPACGSSAACVHGNTCLQYPTATTVGTITLTGIGSSPIAIDPISNNYQPKSSAGVPYPPCSEGDTLTLAAAGGGKEGFEIAAKCIAPLVFDDALTLQKGQPLKLTWSAPGQPNLAKVGVKLDISHHGGSTGKVECEVPDTGSLELPATLVDRLIDLGVAGFPTIALTRKVVAAGSGRAKNVTFTNAAPIEQPVVIPGLVSCSEDTDCPSGQACQTNRACK